KWLAELQRKVTLAFRRRPSRPPSTYEHKARRGDSTGFPNDSTAMPNCAARSSACGRRTSGRVERATYRSGCTRTHPGDSLHGRAVDAPGEPAGNCTRPQDFRSSDCELVSESLDSRGVSGDALGQALRSRWM